MVRTKYKILQIREDDFNKFEETLKKMQKIHPELTGVEFFKLIFNFWHFHNDLELEQDYLNALSIEKQYKEES